MSVCLLLLSLSLISGCRTPSLLEPGAGMASAAHELRPPTAPALPQPAVPEPTLCSIPASDPAFRCSDCVSHLVLPDGAVRFDRVLDTPGRGYRWDNPGARIAFRTDARRIVARLRYSELHTSPSARAPVGLFRIDGSTRPGWTFTSRATATVRPPEELEVSLPVPAAAGFHDYELVMPYGDSVDFLGLRIDRGARLEAPPLRRRPRYVAYGDSITHGFTASNIGRTYAYLLAEARGWELINLGFGGRTARPAEGDFVARQTGDIVSVFVGTNEWQGGIAPKEYAKELRALFAGLRARQPAVPVVLISALWVSPAWKPAKALYPLEDYRAALRSLVAELADPAVLLVEGLGLIDHEERLFDPILVHPNDAGFAQMAERLERAIVAWPAARAMCGGGASR